MGAMGLGLGIKGVVACKAGGKKSSSDSAVRVPSPRQQTRGLDLKIDNGGFSKDSAVTLIAQRSGFIVGSPIKAFLLY